MIKLGMSMTGDKIEISTMMSLRILDNIWLTAGAFEYPQGGESVWFTQGLPLKKEKNSPEKVRGREHAQLPCVSLASSSTIMNQMPKVNYLEFLSQKESLFFIVHDCLRGE